MRKPNTKCKICDISIYKRPKELASGNVYCSKACYGRSCRKEFPCLVCGKLLLAGTHKKTCSKECSNKSRVGLKYKRKTENKRNFSERVFEEYGKICMVCGYINFVDAHHIIKQRLGGEHTVENGIPLCPNHHEEAEYGMISVEELRRLKGEFSTLVSQTDSKSVKGKTFEGSTPSLTAK